LITHLTVLLCCVSVGQGWKVYAQHKSSWRRCWRS